MTDSLPTSMTAIRMHAIGGPDVLRLEQVPVPSPGPGQVLIRTRFAGLNPVDWKVREGPAFLERMGVPLPIIPGWDTAGDVVALGEGVSKFAVGDAVFGMPHFPKPAGCYAEFVAAAATDVEQKPANLPYDEAAAVPLAGLTAWQALDAMALPAGATLLVQAAAGGVGHLAVQLAKQRGLRVIGTCSARNVEFVRSLGADEGVDYTAGPIEHHVRDVDAVLDPLGLAAQTFSVSLVKRGGIVLTIVGLAPETIAAAEARGVRTERILVHPAEAQLAAIRDRLADGSLRVHVGKTYPLADAGEAQVYSKAGRARGKIVLATHPAATR